MYRHGVAARVVTVFALVVVAAVAPPAQAAFGGANGKIAYAKAGPTIHTMNADGSGDASLGSGFEPSWSADGREIAFVDSGGIWVMNADGSGRHQIASSNSSGLVSHPTWAPNGTRLAFARENCVTDPQYFCTSVLETINSDGTGETTIQNSHNPNALEPSWSPDGTKIAFTGRVYANNFGFGDIYTINPDGTGETKLTNTSDTDELSPDWSPDAKKILAWGESEGGLFTMNADGTGQTLIRSGFGLAGVFSPDKSKIAFQDTDPPGGGGGNGALEIWTMNADGSGATQLTNDPSGSYNLQPSWQPVTTGPGYPRPKGATPFQTYLTVAYLPCAAPTRQHGAPLSALSCSPPLQASSYLTVGTLDANGEQANAVGVYRLDVKPGNPSTPANEADVKITFALKDVRKMSDLSDYTGELRVTENWRITDKDNGPNGGGGGSDPATVEDIAFPPLDVACAATADTTIGSSCDVVTSANSIVPGAIQEGKRMNGELGQVEVHDGGADGIAATETDNTLFLDEGIFVP